MAVVMTVDTLVMEVVVVSVELLLSQLWSSPLELLVVAAVVMVVVTEGMEATEVMVAAEGSKAHQLPNIINNHQ